MSAEDAVVGGGGDRTEQPSISEAVRTTEAYETDDGVVLFDAENPLAWVHSETAIRLDDAA